MDYNYYFISHLWRMLNRYLQVHAGESSGQTVDSRGLDSSATQGMGGKTLPS